jgi:hypothetical protein
MRFTFPPYDKKISGIKPKMNYKRYGVNIISLIPSPPVGEGWGEGE